MRDSPRDLASTRGGREELYSFWGGQGAGYTVVYREELYVYIYWRKGRVQGYVYSEELYSF